MSRHTTKTWFLMKENTNKAIAINTLYLYVRLVFNAVSMLFCTRFALKALGVDDFGLYSVLGSIVSFMSIMNTIMLSTSNRFIAVAIGKGDNKLVNSQLNVNIAIHVAITVLTIAVALPIGSWYIGRYVNYDGDISLAYQVFRWSVIGSALSFLSVPYNGLLMAKEKFSVFCITDILVHAGKMSVAFSLIFFFENKLLVYAASFAVLTAIPALVYMIYCNRHYPAITHFYLVKNKQMYREVFSFSVWVGYGAIATIGRMQAGALLVNAFFNTAMNAALGVANQINSLIGLFSQNVTQPIAPQVTKNYTAGNYERCFRLLVANTKISYLTVLFVSMPFLLEPEWILHLWLGKVPDYVISFMTLIIIDTLIGSINAGVSNLFFANGNIKAYQLIINTMRLVAVLAAYFVLKAGHPAHFLFYTYIAFTIINFFVVQFLLRRVLDFDNGLLIKGSYLPSVLVTLLFIPIYFMKPYANPLVLLMIAAAYLAVLIYFIGLNKQEQAMVGPIIEKFIYKIRRNNG